MLPLQITTRSMPESLAIEEHIKKRFHKLLRVYKKIQNCRIVLDVAQKHQHKGKIFNVSIDITIPGKEIVSKKKHVDLYLAIRDAFDTAESLLNKHSKRKHQTNLRHPALSIHCHPDQISTGTTSYI